MKNYHFTGFYDAYLWNKNERRVFMIMTMSKIFIAPVINLKFLLFNYIKQ